MDLETLAAELKVTKAELKLFLEKEKLELAFIKVNAVDNSLREKLDNFLKSQRAGGHQKRKVLSLRKSANKASNPSTEKNLDRQEGETASIKVLRRRRFVFKASSEEEENNSENEFVDKSDNKSVHEKKEEAPELPKKGSILEKEDVPAKEAVSAKLPNSKVTDKAKGGDKFRKKSDKKVIANRDRDRISLKKEPHSRRPPAKGRKDFFQKPTSNLPKTVKIGLSLTVKELADKLAMKANDMILKLMNLGIPLTINQSLDRETATLIIEELNHKVVYTSDVDQESEFKRLFEPTEETKFFPSIPVVTIMGHVDHGKTSLLDALRSSNLIAKEAGNITQNIGAYHVETPNGIITFIDTPGHESFTAMRARGIKVTDLVVLVVAADDGVMPQTVEAIQHAKAGNVPIVVAANKIDKPDADLERLKTDLSAHGILSEDWGGENIFVEISAKKKLGIDNLLEAILLQAEILSLQTTLELPGKAIVIKAEVNKRKGKVVTVLGTQGILKRGDTILSGTSFGRIRALYNESGQSISEARPKIPVEIIGFDSLPPIGEELYQCPDEKKAKEIAGLRAARERESIHRSTSSTSELFARLKGGGYEGELNLIIKCDNQGSLEAVDHTLGKLSNDRVTIKIISKGIGGVNEADCYLAQASTAILLAFNVRPTLSSRKIISKEKIDIRCYSVIYDLVDDIKKAINGLLKPEEKEKILGIAEVKEVFPSSQHGNIAGCVVSSGSIKKGSKARILRDGIIIHESIIKSLRSFKETVFEVGQGKECGIVLKDYSDVKINDLIELFESTFVEAKISW